MRIRIAYLASLLIAFPLVAGAQGPELKLPSFSGLEGKAVESVDLTIGPLPLSLMDWVLNNDDPETVAAKKLLKGLKSIRIRSYEFESDNAYSKSDIDGVRAQLAGPGWSRLLQIRDRSTQEDVDVFVAYKRNKIIGLAVVASQPREFSILNIVGEVAVEDVATLQKHFDVPETSAWRYARQAVL